MHPDDLRYKSYKNGETFECEWINGRMGEWISGWMANYMLGLFAN